MRRFGFAVLALLVLCSGACAQSSPGLIYGQVPTAAQWNSYFAAKADAISGGYLPLSGGTISGPLSVAGELTTAAASTAGAGLNLPPGAAPTSPKNGDIWTTSSGLFAQINGSTIGPFTTGTAGNPCTTTASSVQYDAAGSFGCVAGVTSNGTAMTFAPGDLILTGSSAGSSTLNAAASGGGTATLPAGSGTLVYADVAASLGGTGIDTSSSTGVPQISSGTWTVSTTLPSGLTIPTPSFAFGTGANSTITGTSPNSGFTNKFTVQNSGDDTNPSTQAVLQAMLGTGEYLQLEVQGGAGPAPVASIFNGPSTSGGLHIYPNAGPLTITTPTLNGNTTSTGAAPTCAVTGAGSTGSCAVATGGNDLSGKMVITAGGSGITDTGTLTLTLASSLGANASNCKLDAVNGTGTWTAPATFVHSTLSQSTPVFTWYNASTNLTTSDTYGVSYHCIGY